MEEDLLGLEMQNKKASTPPTPSNKAEPFSENYRFTT